MNLDKIRRLKQKYEDTWMKYDDVYGVGIGYKTVDSVRTDQISIIVYTTNKKPLNNIPEAQRIPESVEEIPVDVVQGKIPVFFNQETADIQAEANAPDINMYRPMVGGIQLCHLHEQTSQHYILSVGTLGMFVKCKPRQLLRIYRCRNRKSIDAPRERKQQCYCATGRAARYL